MYRYVHGSMYRCMLDEMHDWSRHETLDQRMRICMNWNLYIRVGKRTV